MGTSLNSFIEIFNTGFNVDEETVQLKKIAIPIIQRDYAQGRIDAEVNRIRGRFLDSLHQAIMADPITLDFVYGDINHWMVSSALQHSFFSIGTQRKKKTSPLQSIFF